MTDIPLECLYLTVGAPDARRVPVRHTLMAGLSQRKL